jgi:CDP-2,3-bis-(O-geranylgeranyl)-sn-glycerol synthase
MMRLAQLLYLMLPVYLANMAPPFVKFWRGWNPPISARLLGKHKTVVGFAAGVAVAVVVTFIQSRLRWGGSLLSPGDWLAAGSAAGFGAMAGDSLKSFFKRRLRIAPGQRWIPFDQLDFIVGGLLALGFFVRLDWIDMALICAISFVGDLLVNQLSFYLGIKETRW